MSTHALAAVMVREGKIRTTNFTMIFRDLVYAIFALRIRRNDVFNTVTSAFYFFFLFASSMFYPIDPLPRVFQVIALANPITWHVDVLRYLTIGLGSPATIALEAAAFTVFTFVSFGGAHLFVVIAWDLIPPDGLALELQCGGSSFGPLDAASPRVYNM